MKNMDFVIGTLYEAEVEPGSPSSSSVPIWPGIKELVEILFGLESKDVTENSKVPFF
jgi:hypothetical protein